MKKRSIVSVILLSIITCGIYALVISFNYVSDLESEGVKSPIPAFLIVIMLILFSAVGGALLAYAADAQFKEYRKQRGLEEKDNLVLWMVIGILLPGFLPAFIQCEVNKLV